MTKKIQVDSPIGAAVNDAASDLHSQGFILKPESERMQLGALLVSIAREAEALTDEEHALVEAVRDKTLAKPLRFE